MNTKSWAAVALCMGTSIGSLAHHIAIGATAGLLVMGLVLALAARRPRLDDPGQD